MPASGPVPLPDNVRRLRGNAGKRPARVAPQPAPGAPPCPSFLDAEARKLWRELVPELERTGTITQIDGPALAALCMAWSMVRLAWDEIHRIDPEGGEKKVTDFDEKNNRLRKHPAAQPFRDNLAAFVSLCDRFGLTPAARLRMSVPKPAGEPNDLFD